MGRQMDRRKFLQYSGIGAIAFLAGCAGNEADPDPVPSDSTDGTATVDPGSDGDDVFEESEDETTESGVSIFDRPSSYAYELTGEWTNPQLGTTPIIVTGHVNSDGDAYEREEQDGMFASVRETYRVDGVDYIQGFEENWETGVFEPTDCAVSQYEEFSPGFGGYATFELYEHAVKGYSITDPTGTETVNGEAASIYEFELDTNAEAGEIIDSSTDLAGYVKDYRLRLAVSEASEYLIDAEYYVNTVYDSEEYAYDFRVQFHSFDEDFEIELPSECGA